MWSKEATNAYQHGATLSSAVEAFVRASQRTIEFEKGKAGIAVALPALIDTLITAVRHGELDERGGPALRDSSAAWLRWILGPPISPRLPA
jgi:hypothetical protein